MRTTGKRSVKVFADESAELQADDEEDMPAESF
jgi:hypothetical protein